VATSGAKRGRGKAKSGGKGGRGTTKSDAMRTNGAARKPARVAGGIRIGWAQADITPARPCLVCGQFYARISEEVLDPVTATALALDSGDDQAVLVSCDLVAVPDELRDEVRRRLASGAEGLDPRKVVLSATHTHTGPEVRLANWSSGTTSATLGVELDVLPVDEYQKFAAERIADAARRAWATRAPGAVAFGQGTAVIGRNRRWVDTAGVATMYGRTDTPAFSHIEGYEDHGLGLVATYGAAGRLTGLVVNVPCPSQTSEHLFALSADYWCETRRELRRRFGKRLFILAQCSAAGDQSPHLIFDKRAHERMLELRGRTARQEIASRIAAAVADVLPFIETTADRRPLLRHRAETVELPMNALSEADVRAALAEAAKLRAEYDQEKRRLDANPALKKEPRWYKNVSAAWRRMRWFEGVAERFERQKAQPTTAVELHVVRLGDLAVATNPFEYYLDFGVFIKARSRATQTMLVQLAGGGTYCPSARSLAGGGYGSLPASNPVGPAGGRKLAERTIEVIADLWPQA
jgi:hypothetical protein